MPTLFAPTESSFTAEQNVGSTLDYGLDWSDFLASRPGDAIAVSAWEAQEPGITLARSAFSGNVTTVWLSGGAGGQWYTLQNTITTADGRCDSRLCLLYVKPGATASSGLFKNRAVTLATLRRDRLMLMATNLMPGMVVTDDYLWEKLRAAEAYVSSMLRVKLAPTRFFPIEPTAAELAAIGTMDWEIEPGYDYEASMFERDKWGYLVTRQRPIISVAYMRFAYPTQRAGFFDLPLDWLRIDHRAGHVRIVPSGMASMLGLSGFGMNTMLNRRTVPDMVQLSYTAGLANAAQDYPELIDVVKKKAVLSVLADSFVPQSGSISADGLSQSMSMDLGKYSEAIDEIIHGPKGSNGGLMTKIHGIRGMVF